jgi:hypothetical protein
MRYRLVRLQRSQQHLRRLHTDVKARWADGAELRLQLTANREVTETHQRELGGHLSAARLSF